MDEFHIQRERMVADQIEGRGLRNPRLLEAFRAVPRHLFVPASIREHAYEDKPLPIGNGQTISQPYIVALMTNLLNLQGFENVLEIGTGSGYQAAILSLLAGTVHTVERFPELAENAGRLLSDLGYENVYVHTGDGSQGWPVAAPYQAILVTAAAPSLPEPLVEQLDENGLIVIPVGGRDGQDLQFWTRERGKLTFEFSIPVSFVPLRGRWGWEDSLW